VAADLSWRGGVLEVPAARVRAVLGELLGEPDAGDELRLAGLIDPAGEVGPALRRLRGIVSDPGCGRLVLAAGQRAMHGRVGRQWSVVVTAPDEQGRARVVAMATTFLPKCVLRAVGLLPAVEHQVRSPLTWTLSTSPATAASGGEVSLVVADDGELCHRHHPGSGWAPVGRTELYCRVAELVCAALPHPEDTGSASARVGV
jgi:hypothetical protein